MGAEVPPTTTLSEDAAAEPPAAQDAPSAAVSQAVSEPHQGPEEAVLAPHEAAPTKAPKDAAPVPQEALTAPPAPQATVIAAPGKGITAKSADGNFAITLRARIQLRDTFTHTAGENSNEAQVRTLRFVVSGHVLSPDLKYTIQLAFGGNDFEKDSASPIFDAFLDYTKLRDLNVRIGQYFVPFDRARTIREFALQLVDRQLVVRELTLDRDFGLMFSSQDLFGLQGRLAYHLFVGSGDGRNRFSDAKASNGPQKLGVLTVGRLVLRPMGPFDDDQEGDLKRLPHPRLALGVAGAYNHASNRQRSTTGSTYTLGTFNYWHGAADLVLKWRGFSLLTEGVLRRTERANHSAVEDGTTVTEWSQSGYGYFVQAGQMLTDHVEVVARWDHLFAEQGTDPAFRALVRSQGRQLGAGANYYLNDHAFKVQTDYFLIYGESLADARHVVRLQVDASF